eukprot:CAMPEP_0172300834 /NCGR_PEP_ID=MMETSP1058-20130122/2843_1 /TAXON_ID=83371 /ORGANISM="Detonula confervacea, Strain CCMP 353" /LENGTH=284 /DNA_ID=CAMNT_0013010749 /DNA_START=93 /DNA_END=947 /DNA_ORIENTATION=-
MSDDLRETAMIELKALMKREEDGDGYGAMKTLCNTEEIVSRWYEVVDRLGFDREVVAMALGYFDRYMQIGDALPRNKLHVVLITSIFLAIKTKGDSLSEGSAASLVKALGTLSPVPVDTRTVLDMEEEMINTLDWRLNAPTMHQFAASYSELHPLRRQDIETLDYLYEVTRFQVEQALFHKQLMINYKPSVLAYAAMLRAEEQLDYTVLTLEIRDQFLSLQPILNFDPSHVGEAMFALENAIPQVPDVVQMMEAIRGRRDSPATSTVRREENIGSASPTGVAVF